MRRFVDPQRIRRLRRRVSVTCALVLAFFGRAASADQSPVITTPALVEAAERDSIRFTVSASDPDGDLITGLGVLQLPIGAVFTVDLGASRGTFRWQPDYSSAGSYPLSFYAENSIRSNGYTLLQINNRDRLPVIDAPSSVPGVEGQTLEFTASVTDLDGDSFLSLVAEALPEGARYTTNQFQSFARITWTPQPGQGGSYKMRLISTTRPLLSPPGVDTAAVTITVAGGQFSPRVFAKGDEKTVLLGPGTGQVCVHIEPRGTLFDPALIIPSTVELVWSPGLHLLADEVDLNQEDADGNRVKDVTVCFSRNDLKHLLANQDLPKTSHVTVRGVLVGGGTFSGVVDMNPVLARTSQVFLTPNPSRGNAVLSFYTSDTGWTQLRIFDVRGRLLQTLVDERYMRAGFHNVRLDESSSKHLPTGVYFYKLDTVDASLMGRFLIIK